MELHRHDMIRPATAQFGIADNSMAMALPRDASQRKCNELRRFAKAWKSVEEQGTATAMYARRRIDWRRRGSTGQSNEKRRNCVDRCCSGKAWHRRDLQWRKNKRKGIEMKALIEIILMWSAALAVVLAAFLLNLWLVHLVELLVGAKGTWGIIVAAAVMATGWIFSFGSKKENQ